MYGYDYETLKEYTKTERGQAYVKYLEDWYNERYANLPILALNYSYAKLFYQTGDRVKFQDMYFDRRKRLMILQVLAVANEKYIEPLEEIISAICDEFTWVVPAHTHMGKIDLFSAETAMYLAETYFVLKDKISSGIQERIYSSVQNKIVEIYENNTFRWESLMNNWQSVCAWGIGLSYLYLFPERFDLVKERILTTVNRYVDTLDEEGYCNEGYSYWVYGFGFFCLFYDVYEQLFGVLPAILDCEKIKKTLEYGKNCILDGTVFLPFADGGSKGEHDEAVILPTIERMFGVDLSINQSELFMPSSQALGYRVLSNLDCQKGEKEQVPKTIYYNRAQVFIHKNGNYAFAVKGGHNDESHNHTDIGAFSLVANGKQYIADIGVGEYTKNYFSDLRYESFPCNSLSHSVPIIDGKQQEKGTHHYGEVIAQEEKKFSINLAKAYDGVGSLIADYTMETDGICVTYSCDDFKEKIVFRFVSFIQPKIVGDRVCIENLEVKNEFGVLPNIEKVEYAKYLGEPGVAYTVDYELVANSEGFINFSFKFQ